VVYSEDEIQRLADQYEKDNPVESAPDLGEDWRDKAYTAKEQLVDAFVEFDDVYTLVAHGKIKNSSCGTFLRRKVKKLRGCLRVNLHNHTDLNGVNYANMIFAKRVFYSCNRPECPSCGVSGWAVREALRAEARLKYIEQKLCVKFEHIIISPPQKKVFSSDEELRKFLLGAMLARGVVGGLWVHHYFRYHGFNESFVGERPHYFKGQHFHVLGIIKGGYGNCRTCWCQVNKTFDKCKECNGFEGVTRRAYDKDGVIAKVKEERKTLGGTVWYELSHASLRKDVKKQVVVNWFGAYGRNKLKVPKGFMPQKENLCEICHEKLYDIKFKGDYRELLTYMAGFKDSHGFKLNYKDKDGNVMWDAVIEEKRGYG
jgi:hypothetical protein